MPRYDSDSDNTLTPDAFVENSEIKRASASSAERRKEEHDRKEKEKEEQRKRMLAKSLVADKQGK